MKYIPLIARILFSMVFVFLGLNHFVSLEMMSNMAASNGVPFPVAATLITGTMIVLGGFSVLLGYKARIGGLVLALFLIPTAFIMHSFWGMTGTEAANQMVHFMKNLSMAGGALLIYYYGPGPISLDHDEG
jgi:putative oxidoreductase